MIRQACESDISAMHRVRVSVRENRLSDASSVVAADYARLLRAGSRAWLYEVDGHAVGFACSDLQRASVWALFVDPRWEGRGIGRQLHDTLLDWMFDASMQAVWLTTEPGTRAERFYRERGWTESGRQSNGELRFEMTAEAWRSAAGRRSPR